MITSTKDLWSLILPYWRSDNRRMGFILLGTIILLNLVEIFLNVQLNKWYNDFYNALQALDKDAFVVALGRFLLLAATFIIVIVYKIYIHQALHLRWRRWMTFHFLTRWMERKNYYRMQLVSKSFDNPDQRISEDVGQFIDLTLSLSLGLFNAVITLSSFLVILWNLSGSLAVPLGRFGSITVPGYMVWAAILYAVIGTFITSKLGRRLIGLNFNQQKYEADFRYSLVRFRENSEAVAFYHGEAQEHDILSARFGRIFTNFRRIMQAQRRLTWFTAGYAQIAIIFPFIVASPLFFAKRIQFGGLMQTASAFGQVQGCFSFIINAYSSIVSWSAVAQRLSEFNNSIPENMGDDADGVLSRVTSDDAKLIARNMSVSLPSSRNLLHDINLNVTPGQWLLIKGSSGRGKSTLLRALAGIWPFVTGELVSPPPGKTIFLPQKTYLPLGTLADALCYPEKRAAYEERLADIMALCGLSHLESRLNDVDDWAHILSPGEQQRIAFGRILLLKPAFIFLDEATAALDDTWEATMYGLIKTRLPVASVVSVGHRLALEQWHDSIFVLPEV